MMNYTQAIEYLYAQLPVYHHIGPGAYKKDLANTLALCAHLDNPQHKFKSIHVTGTNGKGSSSHMLAAILQSAGYKTGLYTSPHLKDFTERIKINGADIPKERVAEFVNRMIQPMKDIQPSFFELTVAMAFEYFALEKVDMVVVEVGLGGRLDSTNIINPEISLITNIGYDHMDILGDTLIEIAREKAGIIKPKKPVVISERQTEVETVFMEKAAQSDSPIYFASDQIELKPGGNSIQVVTANSTFSINPELTGAYQSKNLRGVIQTAFVLEELGYKITQADIVKGINDTVKLTGLKGRWQKLRDKPLVICDTGHNAEGISELIKQIKGTPHQKLRWVFGIVKDKSPDKVLRILPTDAEYYFCQAKIPRAMQANELYAQAIKHTLRGQVIPDVKEAVNTAIRDSAPDDLIMIGGSTFVVAEVEGI
jgi:dihydrofolate synthase/folylpolyglutamate synthase